MKSNFMLLAAVLVLSAIPAYAATIVYDNLSASTGATSGGTAVITSSSNGPLADSFSTGAAASFLSDVKLYLSASAPSDGKSITVGLYSNATNKPGTLIGSLGSIADSSLTSSLTTIDLTTTLFPLTASTRYWIELSTTGSGAWSFDSTNVGVGVANEYNYFAGTSFANSSFTPYQMTVTTTSPSLPPPSPPPCPLQG